MRASPPTHMAGDHSASSLYRVLADRCLNLEASHAKLEEELRELVEEKKKEKKITNDTSEAIVMPDSDKATSDSGWGCVPGFFTAGSPYKKVLDSMGHAVHVCTAASGEIVYWNHSAENLYGWKDYEVLGRSVAELLVDEEYYAPLNKIVGRLGFGQSWSGQFPFKKRSGENFMAMVTKSPLYEDGKLAGIITVSSDAATFNSPNSENRRTYQDRARVPRINLKKIQQHPRQLIAPVPQIASSVSNLASRLIPRKHDNDTCDGPENSSDKEHAATKAKGVKSASPGALAAKVLSKLHIGGIGSTGKEDVSGPQNSLSDTIFSYKSTNEINNSRASEPSGSHHCTSNTDCEGGIPHKINMLYADSKVNSSRNIEASEESCQASIIEYNQCLGSAKPGDPLPRLSCKEDENELEPEPPNLETADTEVKAQRQKDGTSSTVGSPPSRGDRESSSVVDCEIHWEDLQLGEEIGQGSYAVVHRGIWNGSDVAVKVYFGNQYREETLQDYKKEIDIMKRLRHPNVLLFMGAVYSPERLAIVTEFLPRGSLFKTLHKNNQALDIRRRLRMALDVARGMNYLHRRNPPIVHRDLKSSNLLVDKNWTVKVGDFGLSRWKNATFITAKSGRGTPQWMAPEVLRNEPSNEKSDVFSFGVILWELMAVSIPWINLNAIQVVGVVGFMDRRLELPEGIDPKVASIIRDCWQSDPEQRPSFGDIIHRMTSIVQRVAPSSVQRAS